MKVREMENWRIGDFVDEVLTIHLYKIIKINKLNNIFVY